MVPTAGGAPRQLTFYPGRRAACAAMGLRLPGLRLVPRRQVRAVPVASRRLGPGRHKALPGRYRRRSAASAADARVRRRRSLARRPARRLLAGDTRLPALETVRGRLGPGPVDPRPGQPGVDPGHEPPPLGPRPDVDRRHDLLLLRPRRHPEPVRLRSRFGRSRATHSRGPVGRALAERRQGEPAHRVREGRFARDLRPGFRRGASGPDPRADGPARPPAEPRFGGEPGVRFLPQPEGAAGRLLRPRRHLHRPRGARPDPQPDAQFRRQRPRSGLVARRPPDCLRVGPQRRDRDLGGQPGRQQRTGAAHRGQRRPPLQQPALVAEERSHRLRRPAGPARHRRRRADRIARHHRSRGRSQALRYRLRLVAERRLPGGRTRRPERVQLHPPVRGRERQAHPGDLRALERLLPRLRPGRRLPLLLLRPAVPAADRELRVQLRRRPRDLHLRARPARGHAPPLPAAQRRGRDRGRERRG